MIVKDNVLKTNCKLHETKAFQSMPDYNYWTGWWNEKPRNIVEETIIDLWKSLPINFTEYGGFEYWQRNLHEGFLGQLEWHQDTGEYHYKDNDYWIADKSLIYYPYVSKNCIGGYLEIADYYKRGTLEESYKASRCIDYNMVERIRPITNRMVLIDSSQMHRVTPVYKGQRICLATSIWKKTPKFFKEHENWTGQGQDMSKVNWEYKH